METENETDFRLLLNAFPDLRAKGENRLFLAEDSLLFEVMRFAADQQIRLVRLEREEPTLESLFMEVAQS